MSNIIRDLMLGTRPDAVFNDDYFASQGIKVIVEETKVVTPEKTENKAEVAELSEKEEEVKDSKEDVEEVAENKETKKKTKTTKKKKKEDGEV